MSTFPPPVPSTRPTTQAGYTLAALTARLADMEQAIAALQLNLASPQAFRIGQLEDVAQGGILLATGQDITISDGHAPTYNRTTGLHVPRPVFAELIFHFPTTNGALTSGVSDPHTSRWNVDILGAYIDTTTFSTDYAITVYVNGTPVPDLNPCNVSAAGQQFDCVPLPIVARADTVTVNATAPGTGNLGVVVRILTG